jgi:hypothetical protein
MQIVSALNGIHSMDGSSICVLLAGAHFIPIPSMDQSMTKLILTDSRSTLSVYQFSRMYWKGVGQQNLPVTLVYPEMVTEIFPYDKLLNFGKENLWFL